MNIKPFKLERYFAIHEFTAPYLMSCSDCEALTVPELLEMADEEMQAIWANLKLTYTDAMGHPLLRREIVKLHDRIDEDHALVVVPEEGIYIAMQTLLDAGDHVVCTYPSYQSLYQVGESLGCEMSYWKPTYDGSWSFDIEELKRLVREDTKLIVMNFPHNPTGATITKDELDAIIKLARDCGAYIFSDEMYRFLEYEDKDRFPSLCDLYEKGVSLFGMSKSFALPGLRIGWLTTQDTEIMNRLKTYKDYTTICSSGPSEILAIMGLRAKDKILRRNKELIKKNIEELRRFFGEYPDLFSWQPPIAGPIGFGEWTGNMSIQELCHELIDQKGLMLLGAHHFDFDGPYFRVGFARENLPEVLEVLRTFLNKNT